MRALRGRPRKAGPGLTESGWCEAKGSQQMTATGTIGEQRTAYFTRSAAMIQYREEKLQDTIKDQIKNARGLAERLESYATRLESLKPGGYLPMNEADSMYAKSLNERHNDIRDQADGLVEAQMLDKELRQLFAEAQ